MTNDGFDLQVRLLTNPDDYRENRHLLEVIQPSHYEAYLSCLKLGASIVTSFKALDSVIELSKKSAPALTEEEKNKAFEIFKELSAPAREAAEKDLNVWLKRHFPNTPIVIKIK